MSKLEFHFIVKQKNCHSSHSFSFLFISFFTHFFIVRSRPIFFLLLSKQLSIFMMSIGHVKTQDFSHLTLHIGDESKNVINLKRKKFFFKMISSNSLIFLRRDGLENVTIPLKCRITVNQYNIWRESEAFTQL